MQNSTVETLIGAVVIAVAVFFLVFAYTTTSVGGISGYDLTARFNRVDGVNVGTDVELSGVKIGTVSAIILDPKTYQPTLHLSIKRDVQIPDDSSVKITSAGLLGSNYLSISPGGSDAMLKPGGQITNTQGSVDLIGLVARAMMGGSESGGSTKPPPQNINPQGNTNSPGGP